MSALVVALLGLLLVAMIRSGLLADKVEASRLEASVGVAELQTRLDGADASTLNTTLTEAVRDLQTRGPSVGMFSVVVRPAPPADGRVVSRASLRGYTSPDLDAAATLGECCTAPVQPDEQRLAWVEIAYDTTTRPAEPGLAVGHRVSGPTATIGDYDVYYVFQLSSEARTLALVQRWVWLVESILVVLLVLIVWIVTRQVVHPVRMAARVAERLSAGRLQERMSVRGQDDLARLASSFNKMAQNLQRQIGQLEELSRVQRRFVSDVSHELRTPLTTVRMAADLLHASRRDFAPDVARAAELLQRELDRFEALLVDLLEISRYDAGAAVLDAEATDIRDVVRRTVERCEPLAERRSMVVRVEVPDGPVVAEVDARRVERVLRNLVVNAVDHGEGRRVVLSLAADEHAVAVGVRDYGVGMTPEQTEHVFERFWRADPARSRSTGGTGLGLPISLEDAHLHGGWLEVWSEPGAGSHFRLTLPRKVGVALESSPLPLRPADADAPLPRSGARR